MTSVSSVGRVPSLFPHVKKNWWEAVFDEFYLRTDGDVVEDEKITESECQDILRLPQTAHIFGPAYAAGKHDAVNVLDLCCGQGRHSIWLAKQYPHISFHGHDGSSYLVNIAQNRATGIANVKFTEGSASKVPTKQLFDVVLVLGNSFGYSDTAGDAGIVEEVQRVLKPGGFLILDIPDASWMQSGIKERSWEWIDGRDSASLVSLNSHSNGATPNMNLLACLKDNFYTSKIYELDEATKLLQSHGLAVVPPENLPRLSRPDSARDEDLGMMEQRHLLIAQKPNFAGRQDNLDDTVEFYIHPSLEQASLPGKGKGTLANERIPAGTLLMVDVPYATVPSVDPVRGDYLFCSKLGCGKRCARDSVPTTLIRCTCDDDVVWCDAECCGLDREKHAAECVWLKTFAEDILEKHGSFEFNMLWVVVRVLCRRRLSCDATSEKDVDVLLSNEDKFAPEQVTHWTELSKVYLQNEKMAEGLQVSDIVQLICKEETNSFCLYPRATGMYPFCGPPQLRGVPYGLALAARAALFNHSCKPNVMHTPDDRSRLVMRATRDIEAGEECCIAYFDLAEYTTRDARNELLGKVFNFTCDCKRCAAEA